MSSKAREEIESQPECWRRAIALAPTAADRLPADGARVLAVGCGSAYNVAHAYARLREQCGAGETDAFVASEAPLHRHYDHAVFFSRTGTTSETIEALRRVPPGTKTTGVTADGRAPIAEEAERAVVLDFADEQSVVETRFVTSALVLVRVLLGADPAAILAAADQGLSAGLPNGALDARPIVFLGRSWTTALADEAALKLRETAQVWVESYQAMEYRHGPISLAEPGGLVWCFGRAPAHLADEVLATGAAFEESGADPLSDLVRAQRLALELAARRGTDPDHPRHLQRSVLLDRSAIEELAT